jgi:hypothetical protein
LINNCCAIFIAIIKSRNHAKLFGGLYIYYFTNKCGRLAKMRVTYANNRRSKTNKLVKSLTLEDSDASIRVDKLTGSNRDRRLNGNALG